MYGIVREFSHRFEKCNGSIICKDLLGCKISEPEGAAAAGLLPAPNWRGMPLKYLKRCLMNRLVTVL